MVKKSITKLIWQWILWTWDLVDSDRLPDTCGRAPRQRSIIERV
ncbi:hypothetical protein AG0111_0g8705 [Alternaria gaisen]|uniref:Uncharacterized protein n=1 Tax=Alternaria gaisen TaxID=167740 RepID=A0ACB6FFC6_9PLEO|nr:hypothetical protein AG0111_0g8705 [Alternaria gaisen]